MTAPHVCQRLCHQGTLSKLWLDLDCDTEFHVQRQAGNNEMNLDVFRVLTELIGKVAAMVIAHIEGKPE